MSWRTGFRAFVDLLLLRQALTDALFIRPRLACILHPETLTGVRMSVASLLLGVASSGGTVQARYAPFRRSLEEKCSD